MASAPKPTATTAARRKSNLKQEIKPSQIITLKLSSEKLRKFAPPAVKKEIKEETTIEESQSAVSAAESVSVPDDPKTSGSTTSAPTTGTPLPPSSMPPPTEGVKKKGVKRTSAALTVDGVPKVRGKPGPKKRPRLEDGSIDHSNTTPRAAPGTAAHKLGPKANQGAINAGLRALDRTGKPCRKWQKASFKIKSFTGTVWELPRWKAPVKVTLTVEASSQGSPSGDSTKENRENNSSQVQSEKSNNEPETEKASVTSPNTSSPAPSLPTVTPSADLSAAPTPTATHSIVIAAPS